jgi:hypothetical protein
LIKIYNLPIPIPPERPSRLQKKPSVVKQEHPKTLWVIFGLLDPDPDFESGYGSTDLIESGSNPDPDP